MKKKYHVFIEIKLWKLNFWFFLFPAKIIEIGQIYISETKEGSHIVKAESEIESTGNFYGKLLLDTSKFPMEVGKTYGGWVPKHFKELK